MFLLQDTQLFLQVCLRLLQSLDRVAQACVLFLGAVGRMQVQIRDYIIGLQKELFSYLKVK